MADLDCLGRHLEEKKKLFPKVILHCIHPIKEGECPSISQSMNKTAIGLVLFKQI